MKSRVKRSGLRTARQGIAALVIGAAGLASITPIAHAASGSGLSVATVSAGIGSGVVTQSIGIATGSPIIGSSGAIQVSGDDGGWFVTGIAADSSTHASCIGGTSPSPSWIYTCAPTAAGWGAGSLHVQINAGSALQDVCADMTCYFGTTAAWFGPGGPQASGGVTLTHQADLSVTLNALAPVNSINIWGRNNGPSRVSQAVITVTGLGNYTASNVEGQCTQSGSTLTCASQMGAGQSLPMQPVFSGGTGALPLHAVITGYYLDRNNQSHQMPDPDSSNNTSSITWTPGQGATGTGGGSGSGTVATPNNPAPSSAQVSANAAASAASASASAAPASASALSSSTNATPPGSQSATATASTQSSSNKSQIDTAPVARAMAGSAAWLWVPGVVFIVGLGVSGMIYLRKRRS